MPTNTREAGSGVFTDPAPKVEAPFIVNCPLVCANVPPPLSVIFSNSPRANEPVLDNGRLACDTPESVNDCGDVDELLNDAPAVPLYDAAPGRPAEFVGSTYVLKVIDPVVSTTEPPPLCEIPTLPPDNPAADKLFSLQ